MEFTILICVNVAFVIFAHQVACYTISEGSTYYRSCSSGYYLQITSASWYCSNNSWTVTSTVNSNCNYQTSCTLQATKSWLGGDPCPLYSKYLNWTDACHSFWGSWGSWPSCPGDCTTHNLVRYRACVKPSGGCGTAPADYISCKRLGCFSFLDISRTTPNNQVYYSLTTDCFVATGRTSVAFRGRAKNDLHIALGSVDSSTSGTHYEFIIGGFANTRSEIRFGISSSTCVSYSGLVLSQTYFDEFWISWIGNYIRFGSGSTLGRSILMSCYHSTPYTVNFIWIRSGWGSTGEWRFPNDVACKHVTNSYVSITTDDTSCNGRSYYACNSGYKQVAGNTQRTCKFGGILSGYPLVCSVSTCTIDIVFIIEASAYTSSIHSALMRAIGDLAGSLKISNSDILAGVITYDDVIDLNIELNDYYSASSLDSSITSIPIPSAASTVNLAEALRVGFYDFFTLSKGNRFTAFRHFVVIAKTNSSQTGAPVADHIRLNPRNQLFSVGISPSTSLITDLKAIAGDNSRYLQVSSPDDLYPQFNTLLQNIAVCRDISIQPITVECELDIVFIVERYNLRYTKRFLAELMENITISSTGIKVGMVLFDSVASTVFRLNSYNSSESIRSAIESISETNQTDHLVDKGLIEARDNVFTAARGDRTNASNYYVIIVGPFESYPEAVAKDIRNSGNNYVFVIHIGDKYQTEYQKAVDTCGDNTKYTNIDSYKNLITVKYEVLKKITACENINNTNAAILCFTKVNTECPIDTVFVMEDTDELSGTEFNDMKSFFVSLVSRMIIGDTAIRVGVVTYADGATTAFPLNQYSTANGVITGITNINQGSNAYNRSSRYVDKALKYIQMNFFTTGNGDRSSAANYYILLARGPSAGNKAAAFGSAIRSIASSDLFIVGINSKYEKEYRRIGGNDSHYFFASSFSNLSSLESIVISAITNCPVPQQSTTTDGSIVSTDVTQPLSLVPFLYGGGVGIGVISFAIIFAIILRRHRHHQNIKETACKEHEGRDPASRPSEEHYTEHGPTVDNLYTKLNKIQADHPPMETSQSASISDHYYIELDRIQMTPTTNAELNTINQQRDTDQSGPASDQHYIELEMIQMTPTINTEINTTNRQRERDQSGTASDHHYFEIERIKMTPTTNTRVNTTNRLKETDQAHLTVDPHYTELNTLQMIRTINITS